LIAVSARCSPIGLAGRDRPRTERSASTGVATYSRTKESSAIELKLNGKRIRSRRHSVVVGLSSSESFR